MNPPQAGVANAGKSAEQTQIVPAMADVPSIVAVRSGGLQDQHQPPRCKLAKLASSDHVSGFAEELDIAERPATERIDVAGPDSLHAGERVRVRAVEGLTLVVERM